MVLTLLYHDLTTVQRTFPENIDQVTSWDTKNGVEQTTYEGGRSFIRCVSEVITGEECEGAAKNDMGECRMVSSANWLRAAAKRH